MRGKPLRRAMGAAGICAVVSALVLLVPVSGAMASGGSQIARLANPAITIVVDHVQGTVTLPAVTFSLDKLTAVETDWERCCSGTATTETAFVGAVGLDKPGVLLLPSIGSTLKEPFSFDVLGSGFFVTGNGDFVTNAHVVKPGLTAVREAMLQYYSSKWSTALLKYYAQNYTGSLALFAKTHPTKAKDRAVVTRFRQIMTQAVDGTLSYTPADAVIHYSRSFYARQGRDIPGRQIMPNAINAHLIQAGDVFPGQDVAVLRADVGPNSEFTLPIGSTSKLQAGDPIFTDTYPYDATFAPDLSMSSQFSPLVTNGIVSKITQTNQGVQLVQTNATFNHGSSGGPAFNQAGKVIGLTTAIDSPGVYDIVGTQDINALLQDSSVVPRESRPTKQLSKALDYETGSHWKAALGVLTVLGNELPNNPYVQSEKQRAQSAINAGEDVPLSSGSATTLIIIIAVVILVLLGVAVAAVFLVRGRSRTPALAAIAPAGGGVVAPGVAPPAETPPVHDESNRETFPATALGDPGPAPAPTFQQPTEPASDTPSPTEAGAEEWVEPPGPDPAIRSDTPTEPADEGNGEETVTW